MEERREDIELILKRRSLHVVLLCGLVFVVSIYLLFIQEKQRMSEEFDNMISDSLKIHTESDANKIGNDIENAKRAVKTAETIFRLSGSDEPREFLENRNAANPVYIVEYITMEEIGGDKGDVFLKLMNGEIVVDSMISDDQNEYFVVVFLPLRENDITTGAFYTRLCWADLLHEGVESAVYQGIQNAIITTEGDVIFNTFVKGGGGNIIDALASYNLTQTEIDRISYIIYSPDMDSAVFLRHGENYFVSSAPIRHNGWSLVSFVRGPDVLLRSANIFQNVLRTSIAAIIITAIAACIIFFQFLFGKRRLEQEKQLNYVHIQRFKAMFNQHSALMLVVDAETREIMDVNPATLNYFGYTRDEMVGHRAQEFNLLPTEIAAEKYRGAGLSGDVIFSAAPYRLKSGKIRLLDAYASAITEGERKLFYFILFDVTDKERYREEMLHEKELLRTTLQSIGDGVVTTDNMGIITGMNNVAEKLTDWDNESAIGSPFDDVFVLQNESTGHTVENPIQKVLETGLIIGLANHTELINRSGLCVPIADSAAPIKDENGQTFGVVMVFRDVNEEKEHNKQVEFLSYHDFLTGLHNRRYVEEMMVHLDKEKYLPISVIMADVNGLKITNDVFGHKTGDTLLKSVGILLQECCEEKDLIARWGGDEFVVIMPYKSLEDAEKVVQKIKDTHVAIEGSNLSLSLSLGCACMNTTESSIHSALQQAEKYMYQQKLLDGKSYRNAIISTLLATLYEKSNETEEHSKRIETYCHAIGRKLHLSSKEMDELSLLALLHDIGKVSIDPNILKKPGQLTPEEWEEMKRHTQIGYRIAQVTPELSIIADLIIAHHERWDGKGYPRGLKGEEIPLACRIIAVTDAYDAMTNDRAYRAAKSCEDAIYELLQNAGTQFDPEITELFVQILRTECEMNKCTEFESIQEVGRNA